MLPSKTRYWFAYIPLFLGSLAAVIIDAAALWLWSYRLKNGIRVFDSRSESEEQFVATIESALDLIELNDPRRYARLMREVRAIINTATLTGGEYSRPMKVCLVDIQKLTVAFEINRDYGIQFLACVLVHEATHGSLFTRRVVQTKRTYARVQRLCCLEMERFAKRLGMDEVTRGIFRQNGKDPKPLSFLERLQLASEEIRRLW